MEYGDYRFGSGYYLNSRIDSNKMKLTTILHEGLHYINAVSTPYGIFLLMLKKVNGIDDCYNYIITKLMGMTLKSHEAISTFSEILYIVHFKGRTEAQNQIHYLRENNKEYYHYIKDLIPLLNFTVEYNESELISVLDINYIIRILFRYASDVDVTKINHSTFQNESQLNKLFKQNETLALFSPDIRFNKGIKWLKNTLQDYKDNHSKDDFGEYIADKISAYMTEGPKECDIEYIEECLAKQKQLIIKIYEKSPHISVIKNAIESISIQEKEPSIEDLLNRASPMVKEMKMPEKYIDANEIDDFYNKSFCSMLLIQIIPIIDSTKENSIYILDIMITVYDSEAKVLIPHRFVCKHDDFIKWYSRDKNYNPHLVVNYILYDKIKFANKSNLLFYCDKFFDSVKDILIEHIRSKKTTIIEYDKMILNTLVIELGLKQYLIYPIVSPTALIAVYQEMAKNEKSRLHIDELLMDDIDFVINSFYNV